MERNNFKRNRFIWFQIWMALCYLPLSCLAQDSIYFQNLTSNEKKTLVLCRENILKFDTSVDNLLVNGNNILPNNGSFKIKVSREGMTSVHVFDGSAMLGSIEFKAIPCKKADLREANPQLTIGYLRPGRVDKYLLLAQTELNIFAEGAPNLMDLKIISYQFTFVPKNGDPLEGQAKSSKLSNDLVYRIQSAMSGDVILIENVLVSGIGGIEQKIAGASYQIK